MPATFSIQSAIISPCGTDSNSDLRVPSTRWTQRNKQRNSYRISQERKQNSSGKNALRTYKDEGNKKKKKSNRSIRREMSLVVFMILRARVKDSWNTGARVLWPSRWRDSASFLAKMAVVSPNGSLLRKVVIQSSLTRLLACIFVLAKEKERGYKNGAIKNAREFRSNGRVMLLLQQATHDHPLFFALLLS